MAEACVSYRSFIETVDTDLSIPVELNTSKKTAPVPTDPLPLTPGRRCIPGAPTAMDSAGPLVVWLNHPTFATDDPNRPPSRCMSSAIV